MSASSGRQRYGSSADIPRTTHPMVHISCRPVLIYQLTWGNGVLSLDAIYSYVRDSVSLSLAPGSNNANGMPIPPFLPQTLTATISDNTAMMLVAKYATRPLKLYAGYEGIRYAPPSDPQTAFTSIAGNFIRLGCDAFNNTTINNTAFGMNGPW
jgi:hypothetical protein